MSKLLALDVAILPPAEVSQRAIQLSAALPRSESQGLRLDQELLPHVTLTQQFVLLDRVDEVLNAVDGVLHGVSSLPLRISGGGRSGRTVWMTLERTQPLAGLHERLMDTLRSFEQASGGADAFVDANARPGDVAWVTGYRRTSGLGAYAPHITLGHARETPDVAPLTFEATTVAACHLGRFCTCRRVLRRWELLAGGGRSHTA